MGRVKKARWGFKIFRLATIALAGYLLASAFIPLAQAVEIFVTNESIVILKGLPITESPQWHPVGDLVGHWGVERVLIGDELVEKRCKQPSYGCVSSYVKSGILTCTIYMPEFVRKDGAPISYKGLYNRVGPDRKPPKEWIWLLGREKAHCLYGAYHD